jgi:hypothetical protein
MRALKARVENGRLVMNEPTDLPEGTVLELVPANDGGDQVFDRDDDMTDEERAYVHERIVASIRGRRAGAPTFDAADVMAELAAES